MRFNKEPSLRSRHSIFERREEPDRGECSIALRQAQSREVGQDSDHRAVDLRRSRCSAPHSEVVWLIPDQVYVGPSASSNSEEFQLQASCPQRRKAQFAKTPVVLANCEVNILIHIRCLECLRAVEV